MQGRRKVWKSGVARSNVVGIMCPPVEIGQGRRNIFLSGQAFAMRNGYYLGSLYFIGLENRGQT